MKSKRGRKRKLGRVDIARLRRTIERFPDLTLQELGDAFSLSTTSIQRLVRDHDLPYVLKKGGHRLNSGRVETLRQTIARDPCLTLRELGDIFSLSAERIRQLIRDHDLPYVLKTSRKAIDVDYLERMLAVHAGWSLGQFADYFEMSADTLSNLIREHNLPMPCKSACVDIAVLQSAIAAHPEWSITDLAAHFEVSRGTISYLIREHNLPYEKKKPGPRKLIAESARPHTEKNRQLPVVCPLLISVIRKAKSCLIEMSNYDNLLKGTTCKTLRL